MPSERDKAKPWQFGLRGLALTTALSPVLIGLACGAFGGTSQIAFLFVAANFLWLGFLLVSTTVLMFAIGNAAVFFAKLLEDEDQSEPLPDIDDGVSANQ